MVRDRVFIRKTNGSSCRKRRLKHLIQPQSSMCDAMRKATNNKWGIYPSRDTAARAQMESEDGESHLIAWTLLVFIAIFALIFANTDEEMPSERHLYREQDDFLDLDDFDS